jgi:hypothetical protein
MAEWFKAAVLKTAVGVSLPWVRIPLSPPDKIIKVMIFMDLFVDVNGWYAIGYASRCCL